LLRTFGNARVSSSYSIPAKKGTIVSFAFGGAGTRKMVIAQVCANASDHDGQMGAHSRALAIGILETLGEDDHTYAVKASGHTSHGHITLNISVESFGRLPEEVQEAEEVAEELVSEGLTVTVPLDSENAKIALGPHAPVDTGDEDESEKGYGTSPGMAERFVI
jgi:hypothetical protein